MKRKLAKVLSLIVIVSTMLMGLAACGIHALWRPRSNLLFERCGKLSE